LLLGKLTKGSLSFRVSTNYFGGKMNFKKTKGARNAKYKK